MFGDEWLYDYYSINFSILSEHKLMSLTELEYMLPFEREIYLNMLIEKLKEKAKKKATTKV